MDPAPRKVLLADLLWRRKVEAPRWLAENRVMRSTANVSQQLRRLDRKDAIKKVPEGLKHLLKEANATNS